MLPRFLMPAGGISTFLEKEMSSRKRTAFFGPQNDTPFQFWEFGDILGIYSLDFWDVHLNSWECSWKKSPVSYGDSRKNGE